MQTESLLKNLIPTGVSTFATDAIISAMQADRSIIAMTAGTKYATDLDRLYTEFPNRTLDQE